MVQCVQLPTSVHIRYTIIVIASISCKYCTSTRFVHRYRVMLHVYHGLQDGRSAMEIAEQCGNQEIIATLKRRTTSASSGNVRKLYQYTLDYIIIIIIILLFIMTTQLYSTHRYHNNFFCITGSTIWPIRQLP